MWFCYPISAFKSNHLYLMPLVTGSHLTGWFLFVPSVICELFPILFTSFKLIEYFYESVFFFFEDLLVTTLCFVFVVVLEFIANSFNYHSLPSNNITLTCIHICIHIYIHLCVYMQFHSVYISYH